MEKIKGLYTTHTQLKTVTFHKTKNNPNNNNEKCPTN